MTNHLALMLEGPLLGLNVEGQKKPRLLLACDVEQHCQQTLLLHKD